MYNDPFLICHEDALLVVCQLVSGFIVKIQFGSSPPCPNILHNKIVLYFKKEI